MPRGRSQSLALLLIGGGLLLLLAQSGFLLFLPAFVRLLLILVVGVAVWRGSANYLKLWQRLALLGLLVIFALPGLGDAAGVFVLGLPAAAFAWSYLRDPRRWWALLPAGVLGSLALVTLFETTFPGWDAAPIFFLGLAATFSYLYLRPFAQGGQRWAIYPAIGMVVLTVLSNDPSGDGPNWLSPIVLIAVGLSLLWWWRKR